MEGRDLNIDDAEYKNELNRHDIRVIYRLNMFKSVSVCHRLGKSYGSNRSKYRKHKIEKSKVKERCLK